MESWNIGVKSRIYLDFYQSDKSYLKLTRFR